MDPQLCRENHTTCLILHLINIFTIKQSAELSEPVIYWMVITTLCVAFFIFFFFLKKIH